MVQVPDLWKTGAERAHVLCAGLLYIDWADGDLEAGPQPQQHPAHVQLPGLAGRHQHRPAHEEAHDGEGEEGGLPAHAVHEDLGRQGAEQGAEGQEAAWDWW